MEKQTYVYVVVNYDYETYDEAMDDFDYSDCEIVSSPSRVFTTPEVALKCALDFAKEEADTYGRPYKISTIENQCEPECNAVLVHLTDDDSASVWAVRRMKLQESYEPHMDEDMPLETFDVTNKVTMVAAYYTDEEREEMKTKIRANAKRLFEAEKESLGLK